MNDCDNVPLSNQSRELDFVTRSRVASALKKAGGALMFREREILKLRYGLYDDDDGFVYSLAEVGRIFRVTRERVRRIEARAYEKLQAFMQP